MSNIQIGDVVTWSEPFGTGTGTVAFILSNGELVVETTISGFGWHGRDSYVYTKTVHSKNCTKKA